MNMTRNTRAILAIGLLWASSSSLAAPGLTAPVNTQQGPVVGLARGQVDQFFNVPFAAPPVRFAPPQPAVVRSSELYATGTPVECWRGPTALTPEAKGQEDCLMLHITRPVGAPTGANLPVMFWIHGGAFAIGSGGLYDPRALVREGNVIVVTINYRVGPFGFLALDELQAESPYAGNYGLADQIAAMTWVKNNIANFGGDPNNVTLFGESAGAISAIIHLGSDRSRGLFHRVIAQSPALMIEQIIPPLSAAKNYGSEFAQKLGCGGGDRLACLRNLDPQIIASNAGFGTLLVLESGTRLPFAPVVDGWVVPRNPLDSLTQGKVARVPVMIGTMRDEANLFVAIMEKELGHAIGLDDYTDFFIEGFKYPIEGALAAPAIQALYPVWDFDWDYGLSLAQTLTDFTFSCPSLVMRRRLRPWVPVYGYEFEDPNSPTVLSFEREPLRGSNHADEIPYLFNSVTGIGAPVTFTPPQSALAVQMRKYWTSFARHGHPNGAGGPNWPKFNDDYYAWVPLTLLWERRNEQIQRLHVDGVRTAYESPNPLSWSYSSNHKCGLLTLSTPLVRLLQPVLF
jgi:para-nitrobenzyl esterase